ncbi:unnamed protein product [Parnassius mnemosyne]|uniref:Uncharacterized protein n=1 Tax=Parnassius mnemosyne TaxID=213953 RepID=A0AAV1KYL5_9NEOP
MRILILLLIVAAFAVSAKYLPGSDNSNQLLNRYKRSDSEESKVSSEDNNSNSNDDDNDDDDDKDGGDVILQEKFKKEQSKRLIKLEKSRLKLLEKQEKEKRKREEEQRKLEEKIAKELRKEEEKRRKEEHRREEKLEKERRKLEEAERKLQEKHLKNERKLQEKTEEQLKKIEENTFKMQEADVNISGLDSGDSIELQDFWKNHIYSKYGITEFNTNLEKTAALRRYMQEELGLKANSTASERRQAVLNLINSKLQTTSEQNELQNQLINYITKVGVQKIRANLEKEIEELKNKTETLNNVNLPWVPVAKQNIADQVLFLGTVKEILSNILPNWLIESDTELDTATNSDINIVDTISSQNENSSDLNITFDSKIFTTDIKVPNPALTNNNSYENVEHTSSRLSKIGDNVLVPSAENSTSDPSFKKNENAATVSNVSSIVSESSSSGSENSQMPLNELANSKGGPMTLNETDISTSKIINNSLDIASSISEVPTTNSKKTFSSEDTSSDLISKRIDSNSNKIISSDTAQAKGSKNINESTNNANLNINTPKISVLEGNVSDSDLISNNTNNNVSNTGNNIFESSADNITSSASSEKTGNAVSVSNDESNINEYSPKIISSSPYNYLSKVAADSQNLSNDPNNRITDSSFYEISSPNTARPEGSLNENNTDVSQNPLNISSIEPTFVNKNINVSVNDNDILFGFSSTGNELSTNDNDGDTLSGVTSAGFGITSTSVNNITTANLPSDNSENTVSVSTDLSNATEPSSHYMERSQPSVIRHLNSQNVPQIISERGTLPSITTGIASDTVSPYPEVTSDANSLFSSQSDSSDLVNMITGSPHKIISPYTKNATKLTNVDSINISNSEPKTNGNMIESNETDTNISKISQSIVTENNLLTFESSINDNEIQESSTPESIDTSKFVSKEHSLEYFENNVTVANNDNQTSNLSNVLSASTKDLKTVSGNPSPNVVDQSGSFTVETAANGLKMVNNLVSPHILDLNPIDNLPSHNENSNITVADNSESLYQTPDSPNISIKGSTDSTLVQSERKIAANRTNISVGDVLSTATNTPIIAISNADLKEKEVSLTSADDGFSSNLLPINDTSQVEHTIVTDSSNVPDLNDHVTQKTIREVSNTVNEVKAPDLSRSFSETQTSIASEGFEVTKQTPIAAEFTVRVDNAQLNTESINLKQQAIEKKVTTDEPFVKTNIVSEVSTEQSTTTQATEQVLADISTTAESDILKNESINGEKLSIVNVPVPVEYGALVINITKQ